jgi:hypothetical protein
MAHSGCKDQKRVQAEGCRFVFSANGRPVAGNGEGQALQELTPEFTPLDAA